MSTDFDLLVIGAGIQGAGVAEAFAEAGFRVAVLEQSSVGAATSSRSSKLIHGGLRYLESGQFQLVRECLQERRWLLTHKPQLVRMVPFYLPIYSHGTRPAWKVRLGLTLYAMLAGASSRFNRFRSIPERHWDSLSGLETNGLRAVFRYYDAQTDDTALTRDVIGAAMQHGAQLLCPASLVGAQRVGEQLLVDYVADGQLHTLHVNALVNCSGPWVEGTNALCTPPAVLPPLDLVAGTHIELPISLGDKIFYVEADDGRAVFVMPWKGHTLVGTTERKYQGEPQDVMPTIEEERYLLRTLHQHFPQTRSLRPQDISDSWAGLRVLPRAQGSAFSRPRETMICTDDDLCPRVVAVAGGKLTSYRATARKVLQRLKPILEGGNPSRLRDKTPANRKSAREQEQNL